MSIYFWLALGCFIILVLYNLYGVFKKRDKIFPRVVDVLIILFTTMLSVFLGTHFSELENQKEERRNYESYLTVALNDLNNNKRSIVNISKSLRELQKNNDTIFAEGEMGYPIYKYPYAFRSMYGNDLFLKSTSQFTIHFLSQAQSTMDHYFNRLKNADTVNPEIFKNLRKYAFELDVIQLLILNELYYQHGILNEKDLQFGELIVSDPENTEKHFPNEYKMFWDKIEKNRKLVDKINQILPPDAGQN